MSSFNNDLFMDPQTTQYGSHMVMTNVSKPNKIKYVNIDTKFSDDYANNNVSCKSNTHTITLPNSITNIKTVAITNIELPMTFFNISADIGNNAMQITNLSLDPDGTYENNGNVISIIQDISSGYINSDNKYVDIIIIPDGQYTPATFKTTINKLFDNIGRNVQENVTDSSHPFDTSDLRFDYYQLTGTKGYRCMFYSVRSSIQIDFSINEHGRQDTYNFKNSLGWLFGFRAVDQLIYYDPAEVGYYDRTNQYDNSDGYGPFGQPIVYAPSISDFNGPRYLYIAMEEFNKGNQNSFVSPISTAVINKNIIARITLDTQLYEYGTYLPANNKNGLLQSDKRSYNGTIDIQKLQFQILNEVGKPISLDGFDFSLCMEIEYE